MIHPDIRLRQNAGILTDDAKRKSSHKTVKMSSTSLIHKILTPINTRLTQAEASVLTLQNTALVANNNVSRLTNDADYQSSTQVNTAIAQVVGAAPAALDTLKEIADKLAEEDNAIAALVAQDTANATAIAQQAEGIAKLLLQFATEKRTVTANFSLLDSDVGTLQLVASSASPIIVSLASVTQTDKRFLLINDSTSTASLVCNGVTTPPGDQYAIVKIANNWVEV